MLAVTSNKWKSPKFKSNFNIYKKVKSEKMRDKERDIIWNTSQIWGTIINNIKNEVQILSYAVYWCSIITRRTLWFSTIIYWQVRIFTCPPRFLKRGQSKFCGIFQKYYSFRSIFCSILFVGDFSFIRGCRKYIAYV